MHKYKHYTWPSPTPADQLMVTVVAILKEIKKILDIKKVENIADTILPIFKIFNEASDIIQFLNTDRNKIKTIVLVGNIKLLKTKSSPCKKEVDKVLLAVLDDLLKLNQYLYKLKDRGTWLIIHK